MSERIQSTLLSINHCKMNKSNRTMKMKTTLIHAALFVAVLLTPLASPGADEKLTPAEAKEMAKEAFLWGMHPVAIYHLRFNFAQNERP